MALNEKSSGTKQLLKFKCVKNLHHLIIPASKVSEVIDKEGKFRSNWKDIICESLTENFDCTFQTWAPYIGIECITIYFYCAVDPTKIIRVKILKDELKIGNDVRLYLASNSESLCEPHNTPVTRNLTGDRRKGIGNSNLSAIQYQREKIKINEKSQIYSSTVINQAIREEERKKENDKNPIFDIALMAEKEKKDHEIFLSKVSLFPISIQIIPGEAYVLLRQARLQGYVRLYFDATGGMVTKDSGQKLLHHFLVMSFKSHPLNKQRKTFPLAELITSDSTCYSIKHFVEFFSIQYKKLYNEKICDAIVTDFSWANLNALIQSLNAMNVQEYLEIMYEAFMSESKHEKITEALSLVFLCSSHLCKNWRDEISRKYGNSLNDRERKFLCTLHGHFYEITTPEEADFYVRNVYKILCTPFKDKLLTDSLKAVHEITQSQQPSQKTPHAREKKDFDDNSSGPNYKKSPFYKRFNKILVEVREEIGTREENHTNDDANPFYNPSYAELITKRHLAYLPFIAKRFWSRDKSVTRPNNGTIEGFNAQRKKWVRNNSRTGVGRLRVNKYIRLLKPDLKADYKLALNNVPDRNILRYKKKSSNNNLNETIRENWKNQSKATLFFDKKYLQSFIDRFINGISLESNQLNKSISYQQQDDDSTEVQVISGTSSQLGLQTRMNEIYKGKSNFPYRIQRKNKY